MDESNAQQNDFGNVVPVVHRIAQQVAATPQKSAVRMATGNRLTEQPLTYAQLDAQANQLAHFLRQQGVQPHQLIGLCLERSLEMLIALLGILKLGAAYLPLDPTLPPKRLGYLIDDAQPTAVLTRHTVPLSEAVGKTAVFLCQHRAQIDSQPTSQPAQTIEPASRAYTIYTSGSTGKPKGVNISHAALSNLLQAMQQTLPITQEDGLLAITTLSFDIATLELLLPLIAGGTVIIADDEVTREPKRLGQALSAKDVTMMQATPSLWQLLFASGWSGKSTLKMLSGGEALPPKLLLQLLEKGGMIWNLYGPTETTIWSTATQIHAPCQPVPIGLPLLKTTCHVLDEQLQPLPAGEVGELYIGGAGIADGYHNRPSLTAEKFIPNPFAKEGALAARLYKTGDLASFGQNGILFHHGRRDHQIKIRGHRVELGEIEATLASLAGIETAVVHPDTLPDGSQQLAAYYESANPIPNGTLREQLSATLPAQMMPAHFVHLTHMPLTPNGKIDRKALPAPTLNRNMLTAPYAPPTNAVQKKVTAVWETVLQLTPIGLDDNFFALGGDSLQAAIIIGKLQETIGSYLYVSALYEAPTVAKLAAYLEKHYPRPISQLYGSATSAENEVGQGKDIFDEAQLAKFRHWLSQWGVGETKRRGRNQETAVFILSPPRSGSTLLRIMLAGHPDLFAPPELDLLTFDTLGQRADTMRGKQQFRTEGLLRAVMHLRQCSADQARRLMADYEQRDISTMLFFQNLQKKVAPRQLVDKSVLYSLTPGVLQRTQQVSHNPFYIHLVRHPASVIHSFTNVRLDRLYFPGLTPRFSISQLAEMVWLVAQQNIVAFLQTVPPERQMRLRFEDLVQWPEETMRQVSLMLGVLPNPLMWQPYAPTNDRLTDGLHENGRSRMVGDVRFHEHQTIDPTVANRWQGHFSVDRLNPLTTKLARSFGYLRPTKTGALSLLETITASRSDTGALLNNLNDLSDDDVVSLLDELLEEKNDSQKRKHR